MSTLKVNNITDLADDAVVTAGVVAGGALPVGSILQVVSVSKTDPFASTASGERDVTGMAASITPSAASSKVLVMVQVAYGLGANARTGAFFMERDTTPVHVGDAVGSRTRATFGGRTDSINAVDLLSASIVFLDAPATASSVTYQMRVTTDASALVTVNRVQDDSDNPIRTRGASSITLMEVAG